MSDEINERMERDQDLAEAMRRLDRLIEPFLPEGIDVATIFPEVIEELVRRERIDAHEGAVLVELVEVRGALQRGIDWLDLDGHLRLNRDADERD